MTQEEKERFFAIYLGQEVAKVSDTGELIEVRGVSLHIIKSLKLRTIDQLSEQEIINLAKIFYDIEEEEGCSIQSILYIGQMIIDMFKRSKNANTAIKCHINSIDYLREIGILIGWKNYTPDQLIELGVVYVSQ